MKKSVKDAESVVSAYNLMMLLIEDAFRQAMKGTDFQRAKLEKTIRSIQSQTMNEMISTIRRNGLAEYQEQFEEMLEKLKAKGFDIEAGEQILGEADIKSILNAEDQVRRFFAQTAGQTRTLIQGITVQIRQRAATEGWSSGKAFRALRNEVMGQHPEFVFIDRAGRKWAPEKYLRMVSRTLMAESQREAHEAAYVEAGVDLVKVSIHGTQCEKCNPWEGEVLSLTGATEGYPTVAEARAAGLFHPNCKHRITAFVA